MRKEDKNIIIDNQFNRIYSLGTLFHRQLSINQAPSGSINFTNIMNFINFQLK